MIQCAICWSICSTNGVDEEWILTGSKFQREINNYKILFYWIILNINVLWIIINLYIILLKN